MSCRFTPPEDDLVQRLVAKHGWQGAAAWVAIEKEFAMERPSWPRRSAEALRHRWRDYLRPSEDPDRAVIRPRSLQWAFGSLDGLAKDLKDVAARFGAVERDKRRLFRERQRLTAEDRRWRRQNRELRKQCQRLEGERGQLLRELAPYREAEQKIIRLAPRVASSA